MVRGRCASGDRSAAEPSKTRHPRSWDFSCEESAAPLVRAWPAAGKRRPMATNPSSGRALQGPRGRGSGGRRPRLAGWVGATTGSKSEPNRRTKPRTANPPPRPPRTRTAATCERGGTQPRARHPRARSPEPRCEPRRIAARGARPTRNIQKGRAPSPYPATLRYRRPRGQLHGGPARRTQPVERPKCDRTSGPKRAPWPPRGFERPLSP